MGEPGLGDKTGLLVKELSIGYPAFFQSFVPDSRAVTGRFLPSVLRRAVPNALAILPAVAALLLGGRGMGLSGSQIQAAVYLMIGVVEAEALLKSCLPLNRLRVFLFTTAPAGFFAAVLLFHGRLGLPLPAWETLPTVLLICAAASGVERLISLLWDGRARRSSVGIRRSEDRTYSRT